MSPDALKNKTPINDELHENLVIQTDNRAIDSMKFGFFLPSFHDPVLNPYAALKHDIETCCLLDDLGVDEVWIGEHHSTGWSTLASAELLIAALARETRCVRFATGVVPLPYHHPLHTAERILLLDHLTDGRAILGCGTGTYVHDMEMIGVNPDSRREHFRAALDVVQALIRGETVDKITPWFTASRAVLQLRPLRGTIETVIASSLAEEATQLLLETSTSPIVHVTPPWGIVRQGIPPWGVGQDLDPLPALSRRVETYRNKAGSNARVRCCVFVHVCDSAVKGIDELMPGWSAQRSSLWRNIMGLPIPDSPAADRAALKSLIDSGTFIVGDKATCSRMIKNLADRLGDPLSFVFLVPGWISHEATLEQVRVLAREVIPDLFGAFTGIEESMKLTSSEAGRQMKRRSAQT